MFFCPACCCGHKVWVREPAPSGARWTFDGNYDKPTISPSILVTGKEVPTDEQAAAILRGERVELPAKRCHSHVEAGVIKFCDDCTHELKGQQIELQPF